MLISVCTHGKHTEKTFEKTTKEKNEEKKLQRFQLQRCEDTFYTTRTLRSFHNFRFIYNLRRFDKADGYNSVLKSTKLYIVCICSMYVCVACVSIHNGSTSAFMYTRLHFIFFSLHVSALVLIFKLMPTDKRFIYVL